MPLFLFMVLLVILVWKKTISGRQRCRHYIKMHYLNGKTVVEFSNLVHRPSVIRNIFWFKHTLTLHLKWDGIYRRECSYMSKLSSKEWFYRNVLRQMRKTNSCFKTMLLRWINSKYNQTLPLPLYISWHYAINDKVVWVQFCCWLDVWPITDQTPAFKVLKSAGLFKK